MSDGAIPGYQGGCNMPTISKEQIEAHDQYVAEREADFEAEIQSYVDEAAEWKLKAQAAEAEIRRIRSAYPDVD